MTNLNLQHQAKSFFYSPVTLPNLLVSTYVSPKSQPLALPLYNNENQVHLPALSQTHTHDTTLHIILQYGLDHPVTQACFFFSVFDVMEDRLAPAALSFWQAWVIVKLFFSPDFLYFFCSFYTFGQIRHSEFILNYFFVYLSVFTVFLHIYVSECASVQTGYLQCARGWLPSPLSI